MEFLITKDKMPVDPAYYTWDELNKTFSTNESNLILDFSDLNDVIFNIGNSCTLKAGSNCTIHAGSRCDITTGNYCILDTADFCILKTGYDCNFKVDQCCTLITGSRCTFDTGPYCVLKTRNSCTINTRFGCTVITGSDSILNTGKDCVIRRMDIFEVIIPEEKIKLNGHNIPGYKILPKIKTLILDGKEIEISEESFESIKKQLLEK